MLLLLYAYAEPSLMYPIYGQLKAYRLARSRRSWHAGGMFVISYATAKYELLSLISPAAAHVEHIYTLFCRVF